MTRKTFFSFHYKRDSWRAGQIRNSNVVAAEDEYGFVDSVEWEAIEAQGDAAVERWIKDQLHNTSVTVVLVGAETAERDWVEYELRESWNRGNGIVAVRIHSVKTQDLTTDLPGKNPLDQIRLADGTPLSSVFKTYDWVSNDGRTNLGEWIEEGFQIREAYTGETALKTTDQSTTESLRPAYKAAAAPTIIRNPSRPWAL